MAVPPPGIDLVSLVTVFDAILTSVGKSVRNYGVCVRILCRIISVNDCSVKKEDLQNTNFSRVSLTRQDSVETVTRSI